MKPVHERPDVRRLLLGHEEDEEEPSTLQHNRRLQAEMNLPPHVVRSSFIHCLMPGATSTQACYPDLSKALIQLIMCSVDEKMVRRMDVSEYINPKTRALVYCWRRYDVL